MIHIAYILSDKNGTYSKFTGASMASVLANTKEAVSFHLLHDGTPGEDNLGRFAEMVADSESEIHFYDVPARVGDILEEGRNIIPEEMYTKRYSEANVYRLLLPQVLPADVARVIFLDADTIVNLDIGEMWQEEIGDSGIAAVPDYDVLAHFGHSEKIRRRDHFLFSEGIADIHSIFNAGVMLMDLNILRRGENLLLSGMKFLREHQGDWKFVTNDILIGFFGRTYRHLPWCFQVRVSWARQFNNGEPEKAIYHYVDRDYSFDPRIRVHTLFFHYLMQSPWGWEERLCSCYRATRELGLLQVQDRLQKIRLIMNACQGKKRAFMGLAGDEEKLRLDFGLREDEIYYPLAPGGEVRLPGPTSEYFYLVFWSNYKEVKALLEGAGLKEYRDFADGRLLMPENLGDVVPDEQQVVWCM